MKTGITVEEVMSREVLCTTPNTKIIDCAKRMARRQVGSIVITEKNKVVGILTEQDLARKVMAKDLSPKKTKIKQVSPKNIYTIAPTEDIYDTIVFMAENKIKHLPVVKDNKLIGIISYKDIIRINPALTDLISFKSALSKEEKKAVFARER